MPDAHRSDFTASRNAPGVDGSEIEKFEAVAARWWDPEGEFAPLHRMQPTRLRYVVDQIAGQFGRDPASPDGPFTMFQGLRVADVGCGGGLMCEPMARLGATVTGLDASPTAIEVARAHAAEAELEIEYRQAAVETLSEEVAGGVTGAFDVVLALEIVEHVPEPAAFLSACAGLVRPGGLLIASTLNRTPQSYAAAIVGAEYLLRWLPRGTHDWRRFPTPDELAEMLGSASLTVVDRKGMVYAPLARDFSLSDRDLSVNYVMTAERPG